MKCLRESEGNWAVSSRFPQALVYCYVYDVTVACSIAGLYGQRESSYVYYKLQAEILSRKYEASF